MQEHDQHVSPIRTWKQLVVVVVLAFAVPIALAVIISQWVTSGMRGANEPDTDIIRRIMPVGEVRLAQASGPKAARSGEEVYGQVCRNCHEQGLAGAPKFGDRTAWAKVIAQGQDVAVSHALNGIRGMPAKGGNPDLDDAEVERAAVYMAYHGCANWKAPAALAPVAVSATRERNGEEVVAMTCGKCHVTGAGGAPKIGDRAAWRERAKNGYKLVLKSALKGHAGMPARGGMAELSDAEIGRAVEYMMNSGADAPIAAPAAAAAAAVSPANDPHAAMAAVPAAGTGAPAGAADGRKVYESTCVACHGAGVAGAPKFGDKAQWAPHIAKGIDHLYANALKGINAMPPKGGNLALSDAELKAAVNYMVAAAM
jgi:cytochrome c5